MGAADVVPGVSGGTIAFITGIYTRFLAAIKSVNLEALRLLRKSGCKASWQYIDGTFLLTVFAGLITSAVSLAKVITYLLANHQLLVWSFFFGLIVISVIHMLKQVKGFTFGRLALFVVGVVFAWGITMLNPIALEMTYLNVFLGGCIAITAMILPGISGSFILLLLGLYTPVIGAVKNFEIGIIVTFAAGAAIGILCFSHVLSALLRKFHDATLVFLTGLMLGTLGKIWPWKEVLTFRENSKGEMVPLDERVLSPMQYEQITGQPSLLLYAVIAMCGGILLVWGLERFANKTR